MANAGIVHREGLLLSVLFVIRVRQKSCGLHRTRVQATRLLEMRQRVVPSGERLPATLDPRGRREQHRVVRRRVKSDGELRRCPEVTWGPCEGILPLRDAPPGVWGRTPVLAPQHPGNARPPPPWGRRHLENTQCATAAPRRPRTSNRGPRPSHRTPAPSKGGLRPWTPSSVTPPHAGRRRMRPHFRWAARRAGREHPRQAQRRAAPASCEAMAPCTWKTSTSVVSKFPNRLVELEETSLSSGTTRTRRAAPAPCHRTMPVSRYSTPSSWPIFSRLLRRPLVLKRAASCCDLQAGNRRKLSTDLVGDSAAKSSSSATPWFSKGSAGETLDRRVDRLSASPGEQRSAAQEQSEHEDRGHWSKPSGAVDERRRRSCSDARRLRELSGR